jgi:biotin-independent malonate decarboxylase gamma subunit
MSRGQTWFDALSTQTLPSRYRSVAIADSDLGSGPAARLLAVVPDPGNPYPRARRGEVGLLEGIGLARAVREIIELDAGLADDRRRPVVAVVDVPSQAYGRLEEQFGEYLYIAAAVDAYAAARVAGHPVITLVVRSAISGGFLGHGLQASQVLALDDDQIEIQAIHKPAAARITLRTVAELDELAKIVTPLSFDVRAWATLGYCDGLLKVSNADQPTSADVDLARRALRDAVTRARLGPRDLTNRLQSAQAQHARRASLQVRQCLTEQWG